jgi:hypothetical protein
MPESKQSAKTGAIGFDNEAYLKEQTAAILERVNRFHDKLYLEFGGKILFDYHAARVLPGFSTKSLFLREWGCMPGHDTEQYEFITFMSTN